jgi:hypothetical protein
MHAKVIAASSSSGSAEGHLGGGTLTDFAWSLWVIISTKLVVDEEPPLIVL